MLCYPIQASLTAPSAWPARETQVSIVLSTGCPTRRETGLQRTCWTAAGLTHGSLERQFSPTSHTKHRKSHFSKQEKAKDFKSPGQTHQTTGTLQLVGQGCAKVSSTTFIPSIWDYSRHSSSRLGKQRQGSQLIAQLHSLPTLSKINSHHAPNLFPLSPLWQQLPEEPPAGKRRLRCPKPADPPVAWQDHAAWNSGSPPMRRR